MSRGRRGMEKGFSYSEPIIPMASKGQRAPDDYIVSNAHPGPGAAADGARQAEAHDTPGGAAYGHREEAEHPVQQKTVKRCVLRGNAMKAAFLACVVIVVVFAVAYLLQKWRKRREKKAEDKLLRSFILPEADRKFLEDAAVREKKARQSAT